MTARPWHEISPADAVGIVLPAEGIIGPLTMNGIPHPDYRDEI